MYAKKPAPFGYKMESRTEGISQGDGEKEKGIEITGIYQVINICKMQ